MSQTNTKITQNMPDHTAVGKVQYHQLLIASSFDSLKIKTDKYVFFLSGCHLLIQLHKVCLIHNLQVASMPGHSIKQTAQREIPVELAQITQGNN